MMILALTFAMLYGPWQLWVLATPTRTIRFRTVAQAVVAGAVVTLPVAVLIEWAWTRLAGRWLDVSMVQLVEWAGWTVDPFVEELVRLVPIIVVFRAVAAARSEWSASDAVVFCAAVGSGFRLGELVARFHDGAAFADGLTTSEGWVVGLSGFAPAVVEYPWMVVGRWLPPGVVTNSPIAPDGLGYNVIAMWSVLGGLAVALWTMVPHRVGSKTAGRACRAGAVLLVAFSGLAHASINAALSFDEWPLSLLSVVRVFEPVYWAWPLAALAVAMVFDNSVLSRHRSPSDGLGVGRLARLVGQRPLVAGPAVWSFVVTRRATRYSEAHGRVESNRDRIGVVTGIATAFNNHLDGVADPDLWNRIVEHRSRLRRGRWQAMLRSPVAVGYLVTAGVLLSAPFLFLVVGSTPGLTAIQTWLTKDGGQWLLLGSGSVGLVFGLLVLALSTRAWRLTPPVLSEARARLTLTICIQVCAVLSVALSLYLFADGTELHRPILSNFGHGLDALASLLIGLGLVIAVGAIAVAAFPVVAAGAGITVTVGGVVTAGAAAGSLIAGGLVLRGNTVSLIPAGPRRPSTRDLLNMPVGPPGPDYFAPLTLGSLILAIAAGWEIFGGPSDAAAVPVGPSDPNHYLDSQGNLRWRDTNQLVSDVPTRARYRDDNGVWRWADTDQPIDRLEPPDGVDADDGQTPPSTTVPGDQDTIDAPTGALTDSERRQIMAGAELGGLDQADPTRLDEALAGVTNQHLTLTINGETHNMLLTRDDLRYILARHHPRYFGADGDQPRSRNTSLSGSTTIEDVQQLMREVIQTGEQEIRLADVNHPELGENSWVFTKNVDGQWFEVTVSRQTGGANFNHIVHFSPLQEAPR